jgi:hypothetical protein
MPSLRRLVAVDLGKRKVGVALGVLRPDKTSTLLAAFTVEVPLALPAPPDVTAKYVRAFVDAAWEVLAVPGLAAPKASQDRWVCEWPVLYANKPKYHEDIKALQAVGDAIRPKWARKLPPAKWKGNVPKEAHHARLARFVTTDEMTSILAVNEQVFGHPPEWFTSDAAHDARDAMGIWLFDAGRTGRGGTECKTKSPN